MARDGPRCKKTAGVAKVHEGKVALEEKIELGSE